jgi:hypothetical protein
MRVLGPNDKSIADLTAVSTLADADVLAIVNAATTKKVSLTQLTAYFEQRARQHNASVANQGAGFASDTYVTGSNVAIPSGRLQAKTKYRAELDVGKTAAGTGTPVVTVRVGTNGSTADAARCTFTFAAANTAAADEAKFEIMATFRSVGSGTSAVIQGQLLVAHQLTTTGFGGTGRGANMVFRNTGGGFDSTVANLQIGLSINGGTGAAWTVYQVHSVLENLA